MSDPVEAAWPIADCHCQHPTGGACKFRSEPAGTPLDVGRLADAIDSHSHVGAPSERVVACGRGNVAGCAPAIAAEYARLEAER